MKYYKYGGVVTDKAKLQQDPNIRQKIAMHQYDTNSPYCGLTEEDVFDSDDIEYDEEESNEGSSADASPIMKIVGVVVVGGIICKITGITFIGLLFLAMLTVSTCMVMKKLKRFDKRINILLFIKDIIATLIIFAVYHFLIKIIRIHFLAVFSFPIGVILTFLFITLLEPRIHSIYIKFKYHKNQKTDNADLSKLAFFTLLPEVIGLCAVNFFIGDYSIQLGILLVFLSVYVLLSNSYISLLQKKFLRTAC